MPDAVLREKEDKWKYTTRVKEKYEALPSKSDITDDVVLKPKRDEKLFEMEKKWKPLGNMKVGRERVDVYETRPSTEEKIKNLVDQDIEKMQKGEDAKKQNKEKEQRVKELLKIQKVDQAQVEKKETKFYDPSIDLFKSK